MYCSLSLRDSSRARIIIIMRMCIVYYVTLALSSSARLSNSLYIRVFFIYKLNVSDSLNSLSNYVFIFIFVFVWQCIIIAYTQRPNLFGEKRLYHLEVLVPNSSHIDPILQLLFMLSRYVEL